MVSYPQILTLKKSALIPLCAFLSSRKAKTQGIAFIDSTKIAVCHNLPIPRHRVNTMCNNNHTRYFDLYENRKS
nr:transposase [Xenorhabdus bovienii]